MPDHPDVQLHQVAGAQVARGRRVFVHELRPPVRHATRLSDPTFAEGRSRHESKGFYRLLVADKTALLRPGSPEQVRGLQGESRMAAVEDSRCRFPASPDPSQLSASRGFSATARLDSRTDAKRIDTELAESTGWSSDHDHFVVDEVVEPARSMSKDDRRRRRPCRREFTVGGKARHEAKASRSAKTGGVPSRPLLRPRRDTRRPWPVPPLWRRPLPRRVLGDYG